MCRRRQNTGRHFVQDDTKGKKIATGVERLALDLLGRHVGDGSSWVAGGWSELAYAVAAVGLRRPEDPL